MIACAFSSLSLSLSLSISLTLSLCESRVSSSCPPKGPTPRTLHPDVLGRKWLPVPPGFFRSSLEKGSGSESWKIPEMPGEPRNDSWPSPHSFSLASLSLSFLLLSSLWVWAPHLGGQDQGQWSSTGAVQAGSWEGVTAGGICQHLHGDVPVMAQRSQTQLVTMRMQL